MLYLGVSVLCHKTSKGKRSAILNTAALLQAVLPSSALLCKMKFPNVARSLHCEMHEAA